ncbi:hypothetical protein SCLCIDRAFT_19531 [Scleroderma citrinum Foug A]|uniref:Uncharacterized protein n=1 Tax=Scleroderma citrinum Foug A TaxID=1036808 RepID=A0A0C3A7R9_9AGAM|nr:hypothetical protein SCLCIDRAFT_19531 [Scleroderma citrinum Foug A]
MSLRETPSSVSLNESTGPGVGPLRGPSSTNWRRQRLLRIGSDNCINTIPVSLPQDAEEVPVSDETTSLYPLNNQSDYGTLPPIRAHVSTLPLLHRRPPRPNVEFRRTMSASFVSPAPPSPSSLRRTLHWPLSQRPISAYDAPLANSNSTNQETDINVRINGFRVWYSSFSSIDWIHDSIKDSVRFSRLRRGKSLRSRVRLAFDKSLGWIIVTIVGFLTAIVAFLVVRSEQWFFDSKYGYCTDGWWKARRFCCPVLDDLQISPYDDGDCPHWRSWSNVIRSWIHSQPSPTSETDYVEYSASTCVAIILATTSCLLTIYLTRSTSFLTRKESGVLSPQYVHSNKGKRDISSASQAGRRVLYYAAGPGVPEIKTILSGFVIHGYLGARTLFTKALGLALSVGSGLSLGKEGPFVHIGCCIGNIVSRCHSKYENNEAKRREILSAACAAGVAVAFGAPIGGTLFSLEEVSYFFPPKVMWRSFFCAMIAAITMKFLDPFGTGKLVLFQVTYDKDWHAYDLVLFVLLGAVGGVYGAYFSKLNYRWSRDVRNRTWLKNHPVLEVILVTLVTALCCFLNPYTRMAGTELVYNLFAECKLGSQNRHFGLCVQDPGSIEHVWLVVRLILMTMVMKGALTVITFGIKVPAGVFIPTLTVGACAGRILGVFMRYFQWNHPDSRVFSACGSDKDCVIPGLYAMVGAAAALSGVTRTTVSLAVIMFELTDTLTYAVPVMLAVLVAKTVADALEPKGIYDFVIELSQLPFLDAKHEYLWADFSISDVTDKDADTIRLNQPNTVKSLRDQLQSLLNAGHDDSGFPILRANGDHGGMRMAGYIGANELEHALAMVADEPDEEVRFEMSTMGRDMTASFSSWVENGPRPEEDPLDFSAYMDQAPLTIQSNSPLPLVHQFFVKLGARYVIVTNTDGDYEGVIDKKTWLAFLSELEAKS